MAKRDRQVQSLAQLFRIMGDETRLKILLTLQRGEHNVTQLCEQLKVAQPTVSHHLGILRMGGLVANRRSGKEIFYSLNNEGAPIAKTLKALIAGKDVVQIGPLAMALQA